MQMKTSVKYLYIVKLAKLGGEIMLDAGEDEEKYSCTTAGNFHQHKFSLLVCWCGFLLVLKSKDKMIVK